MAIEVIERETEIRAGSVSFEVAHLSPEGQRCEAFYRCRTGTFARSYLGQKCPSYEPMRNGPRSTIEKCFTALPITVDPSLTLPALVLIDGGFDTALGN